MNDPRKPVVRVSAEREEEIRSAVARHLVNATHKACSEIGFNGAAFVLVGTGVFMGELSEVNQKAAVKYFRALADMCDTSLDDETRADAFMKRAAAVAEIYASLDLYMAGTQGNA